MLGNPVRLRLVEILCSGSHTSGELTGAVMAEQLLSRSSIQRQLAILVEHGWVDVEPEERERRYWLRPDVLDLVATEVGRLHYLWQRRIGTRERNTPQAWHCSPFDAAVYTERWRKRYEVD